MGTCGSVVSQDRLIAATGRATGWGARHSRQAVAEYGRFVELAQAHPRVALVPSIEVDAVWHAHLALADDGLRAGLAAPPHREGDEPDTGDRFALTTSLYAARWGEPGPLWAVAASCQVDSPPPPEDDAPPDVRRS